MGNILRGALSVGLSLTLYGCGAGSTTTTTTTSTSLEPIAQQSDISIAGSQPGVTPFISSVQFTGQDVSHVASLTFNISPMPNSVSQPAKVTWSTAALSARGYLQANLINLPVFGLYAGYQNQVSFQLAFDDGSVQQLQYQIATEPYTDSSGVYLNPTIVQARAASDPRALLGGPTVALPDVG